MSKRAADLTTVGVLCGEGYFANYDDRLMVTIHVMICWPRRQLQAATAAVVALLCASSFASGRVAHAQHGPTRPSSADTLNAAEAAELRAFLPAEGSIHHQIITSSLRPARVPPSGSIPSKPAAPSQAAVLVRPISTGNHG